MEEEQAPDYKYPPMQAPINTYGNSILQLTNPNNEIYKLELTLRGLREDEDGNIINNPDGWLLNEKGINAVLSIVQSTVNQVAIMSNFEKHEIEVIMLAASDTLVRELMINREKYQIKESSVRDRIAYVSLMTVFVCLKRGYEEGDRKFWKGSQQSIRHEMVNTAQRQGGVLSKLNPWK